MQFTNDNRVEPLYFHEAQQGEALLNNLGSESIIKRKRDESDERNFSDEHEVEKSGVEKKHNICTSLNKTPLFSRFLV